MTVSFQIEPFRRCIPELTPLFAAAFAELGQFRDKMPLAPDWKRYVALDQCGAIFLVTARRDGALIGYMTTSVSAGLHHICTRIAVMDISYVLPECRGRGVFVRMMLFVEDCLRNLNVDLWLCHYASHKPLGFDSVLDRMGFVPTEQNMGKWLGHGH